MMKKKKILEEGLLEKYLLDELSENERSLVEDALEKDSDLKILFEQLEEDFERMAFENAIDPPSHIKKRLESSINRPENNQNIKWPLMAAASLALLFLLSTFWMFNKWQAAEEQLNLIESQTLSLQERLGVLEENYELTNNRLQIINSPNTIPFILRGNEKVPDSRAVAYVNHQNKLVVVNPQGLPNLPDNQTYQMWSDVDGEMIDMGLLPTDKELVTLKYIDRAESLNITIEPAGGNDHPTVEQLISFVTL